MDDEGPNTCLKVGQIGLTIMYAFIIVSLILAAFL